MSTSAKAAEGMQDFWKKNEKLNRPLSPHLTIYRPQITSMLSIMNRAAGVTLTVRIYLLLKENHTFKLGLAFSISFHFAQGLRHLAWDNAKGFRIDRVYQTGYAVVGLTVLFTIALMCL